MKELWRKLTRRPEPPLAERGIVRLPPNALQNSDAIVTTNEVTDRHGTGVILSRIFGAEANVLSVRTHNLYREHSLGQACLQLGHEGLSSAESFARLLYALNGTTVRRVLCVPFDADELLSAIVLKELFSAPLCTFLMDDNNIFSHGIPDETMREALQKSQLRLAISPEMRDAYEAKYGLKFWVVPPVVREEALQTRAELPSGPHLASRTGVLVGSIWSQKWLEQLRETVRRSGLQIHWYGNAQAPWLKVSPDELRQDGILDCGFLPEAELTRRLKKYPYAIVPSGSLDANDDRPEIARLSLPTRLPYLLAASNMPMIVVGSPAAAASRFLERFEVGRTVSHDGARLRQAVEEICHPACQMELRQRAVTHSRTFSATGLAQWIWRSLELGEACDERFEKPFRRNNGEIITYLESSPPADLLGDDALVYLALRRLKQQGFAPDFVLDVGASTGVWSDFVNRLFPKARFLLIEPLYSQYAQRCDWYFKKHPDFECVPVAVSDCAGEVEFSVSSDLYGSSLLHPTDFRSYEPVKVPVRTLDQVAREKNLTGRGLLKIDVQFVEHLVLAGALQVLPQVDAMIVETSLVRYASQPVLFLEMCDLIRDLGFRYYEDVGGWCCPVDGTRLQKDVLFVREELFPYRNVQQPKSKVAAASTKPLLQVEEAKEPAIECVSKELSGF